MQLCYIVRSVMYSIRKGNTNKKTTRKPLVVSLVVFIIIALLAGGSYSFLQHRKKTNPTSQGLPTATLDDKNKINLDPPTESDKNDVDGHKEDLPSGSNTPSPTPPSGSKKDVGVTITSPYGSTSAAAAEVRGYVSANEASGTCTIKLTKTGSAPIGRSQAAVPNAGTMSCPSFSLAADNLAVGEWTLTLSYDSPASQGSKTSTFKVQ